MKTVTEGAEANRWGIQGAIWFSRIFLLWCILGSLMNTPIVRWLYYCAALPLILICKGVGVFDSGSGDDQWHLFLYSLFFIFIIEIPGLGYLAGRALYKFKKPA